MASALAAVGDALTRRGSTLLYACGYVFVVARETVRYLRSAGSKRILTFQILFTGVEALPVTAVLSLGLGAIIVFQGVTVLPRFGQGNLVYTILIATITRELGPILTAFIIAARSGTAITTEIGNMVVGHEIEAYVATGIDPIRYLAVPRFLGLVISLLALNVYFNIFGLLGSFFVTSLITTVDLRTYIAGLFEALSVGDVVVSFAKSAVSGAIISLVATYHGFRVQRASTEVPVVAIKSVGNSIILVIVANAILTAAYQFAQRG